MIFALDGDAVGAAVAILQLDPVDRLEVDQILAAIAVDHAFFLQSVAQQMLGIFFQFVLELVDFFGRLFADAVVVHGPAVVSQEEIDDVAFFSVVGAIEAGVAPVILEFEVGGQIVVVAELRDAAGALRFAEVHEGVAAGGVDRLGQKLLGFAGAGFRHHGFGVLREGAGDDR